MSFMGKFKSVFVVLAKIGLFYLVFYSCLAGFFAVMLVGFFSTLDDTAPTQQKMYSLIKSNPGEHTEKYNLFFDILNLSILVLKFW